MQHQPFRSNSRTTPLLFLLIVALCILLASCDVNISTSGGGGTSGSTQCQSNCTTGSGVQGVKVFVEPDAGESVVVNAINDARKSVWLEMYLLSDTKVIYALEDAANRGIDVRVMLEPHPVGGGTSPSRTIDGNTAFIMTSNFTRSALGGYSGSSYLENREYDIIDTNTNDVQAVISIFNADWNRTTAHFNDPNLVVSPVNSRTDFNTLINSAHHTLLIEAEEMNDSSIEQELVNAEQRGVQVKVILPAPHGSQSDSNSQGIDTIKQGGVQVKEDSKLYMHAKIIVVDGKTAFVGSENISSESLDQNRELGIIVSDAGVLNTLQSTFQYDWSVSQSV